MSNNSEPVQSLITDVDTSLVTQAVQCLSPNNEAPDPARPHQPHSTALVINPTAPSGLGTFSVNELKVEESNFQAISLGGELNVVRQLNAAPISLSELRVQKPNTGVTFSELKVHQLNSPVALGVQQINNPVSLGEIKLQQLKSHPKLVIPSQQAPGTGQVLQKGVNPPLITVLNSTGPLTVVKNLCVSSGLSNTSQYSVVNSTPLTAANTIGKTSTITVLNCSQLSPVNVAKSFESHVTETKVGDGLTASPNPTGPGMIENRGHNVFVKNTGPEASIMEGTSQSHKLLTATNFPQSHMLANVSNKPGPVNGQRNRLKMNNAVTSLQQPAVITKLAMPGQQKYFNRQKITGISQSRHIRKLPINNVLNSLGQIGTLKPMHDKPSSSFMHSTVSKGHLKTLPAGYIPKYPQGIKTMPPHQKILPGQMPRTGVRTIPPQKVQKIPNKPNYIGKHAIQGQKVRQPYGKGKTLKPPGGGNYLGPSVAEKQLTFNQALTAQIIETLSNPSTPPMNSKYEMLSRYDNAFTCPDKQFIGVPAKEEDKTKSGLDALSLICQAVLLDHNYNATLPCESPTRPTPPITSQAQVNGVSSTSMSYAPPPKRRTLSNSIPMSVPSPSLSNIMPLPQKTLDMAKYDDDNASDVSDISDHKHDTEGEETDTAPEAEDVKNEDPMDHYGDYVTRCICGFLHDDGYMVECDKCKVWQHVQCVVKNKQVPDEYLCEICDPTKPVERQKARLLQQQYIRDRQLLDAKIKRELTKMKPQSYKFKSETDSSDAENEVRMNVPKTKALVNRRKSETSSKVCKKESKETGVTQRRQKRKERKLVKKKSKTPTKHPQSEEDNHDSWSSHLPQLRQWIEKYEEAVTNHYSPELRARISSIRVNGTHLDQTIQYDSSVINCRVHTQPLTEIKYLVSTAEVVADRPIIELRGKYMLSNQHRNLCGSLNTRLHTQKPGPFLFFYRLPKDNTEVCVDTRTYGNSARFIRRSCKPNTELRHCIEKGVLHLYIVSITKIEKDCELTLKHESHDLASIGTTQIACACGRPDECGVNKTTIKKNGEIPERKRRAKRGTLNSAASVTRSVVKEKPLSPVVVPEVPVLLSPKEEKVDIEDHDIREPEVKVEIKEEVEVKIEAEPVEDKPLIIKTEVKEVEVEEKIEKVEKIEKPEIIEKKEIEKEDVVEEEEEDEEEDEKPTSPVAVSKRRVSQKSDKEDDAKDCSEPVQPKSKSKKLSREERKLEAILRAIEQMEKADQRKQEHQAKQAHRRESEPSVNAKDDDKGSEPKIKRRRRRGRARTTSTTQSSRRSRLNSTDSYMTSGDEILLSPNDGIYPTRPSKNETDNKDLNLSGSEIRDRTPPRDNDTNSNSTHSSPETPQLSSACLLVQAAVEPMESGFKFPKTKKGLMNEWLNKTPDSAAVCLTSPPSKSQSSADDSDSKLLSPEKPMNSFIDNLQTRVGNAKKRWLRQAISEDHSTEGSAIRPDSPPSTEMVAPPKKRKLPRETLTPLVIPSCTTNNVDISEKPTVSHEPRLIIPNRMSTLSPPPQIREDTGSGLISKSGMFGTSDQLVGAVEKTLSILGFENPPCQTIAQEKRKVRLSISEYRQRKKVHPDKPEEPEENSMENTECNMSTDEMSTEVQKETTMSRQRSVSTSSTSSLTSDDDGILDIPIKVPVFNSEPTELERQREISNMRLKRAFGLTNEPKKPTDLKIPPLLSSLSTSSFTEASLRSTPTPPILKSLILEPSVSLLTPRVETPPVSSILDVLEKPENINSQTEEHKTETQDLDIVKHKPETKEAEPMDVCDSSGVVEGPSNETAPPISDGKSSDEQTVGSIVGSDKREVDSNMFYTPDDLETGASGHNAESSVNYVPPFNNPVYPNNNFNSYASSIDDDSRFQSRNPSPPPQLD